MTEASKAEPVALICGLISASPAALDDGVAHLVRAYGPLAEQTAADLPFGSTDYYAAEFGSPLWRRFVAFSALVDPVVLSGVKVATNAREAETSVVRAGRRCRTVNLDPGYVAPDKLVLATTKNFSHRIYLANGIYGEVTLNFDRHGCSPLPWTYPDYASGAYDPFLLSVRERVINRTAACG